MTGPDDRFTEFGPNMPGLIPVHHGVINMAEATPALLQLFDGTVPTDYVRAAAQPFVGVTTDGSVASGLFHLADEGLDPAPIVACAEAFLATIPDSLRPRVQLPMDAPEWRMWTNAFGRFGQQLHGLCLEGAEEDQRAGAMAVLEATLSPRGYRTTRGAMKLNAWLGEYVQDYLDSLTEWMYWFVIFGTPSVDEPWGWQLWGHHVDLNCVVIGRQLVLTPTFLGAEPSFGPDGTRILDEERAVGFRLFDALRPSQRQKATLYPSMRRADLPRELSGVADGRHVGGAGQDNRVIPYAGIRGDELTAGQRSALLSVTEPYLDRMPAGPFAAKRAAVERYLDDTWFAWIGGDDPDGAYYYRVHSPVVLIEYDNHSGIFLDNAEPETFHVHTIVRTPNGNDYGKDLLRQHYEHHHQHG